MKGHSLLELLIIIMIVAILVALAQPMWKGLFYSLKSYEQVNRFVRSLNYARSMAMIKSKPVMVCPISISVNECGDDWQKGMAIYLLEEHSLKLLQIVADFPGAVIHWNRTGQKITFAANGFLVSQNGSFNYSIGDNQNYWKRIVLSATGRVRVES